MALAARSPSIGKRRRFFQPNQQKATAKTEPGNSALGLRWRDAVEEVVVKVSVVDEAAVPVGVTVAGEKLHDAPVGNPKQLNETAELNPLTSVTEMVSVPLCPAVTVIDAGEVATVKFGVGVLMV